MDDNTKKKSNRTTWPVAGGILMGLGVGFFMIRQNPMALVGSLLTGMGIGIIISSFLSVKSPPEA